MSHSENPETRADEQLMAIDAGAIATNCFNSLDQSIQDVLKEFRERFFQALLQANSIEAITITSNLIRLHEDIENQAVVAVRRSLKKVLPKKVEGVKMRRKEQTHRHFRDATEFLSPEEIIKTVCDEKISPEKLWLCTASAAHLVRLDTASEVAEVLGIMPSNLSAIFSGRRKGTTYYRLKEWIVKVASTT